MASSASHIRCARRLAIVGILVFAQRASAQGTDAQLPDPIAAARLTAYADMLNLSPQQRHALEGLHAGYREEFQKLRDGEIAEFLKLIHSGPYTRKRVMKQRDLLQQIASIDQRLFDRVQELLADEQLANVTRVRMLRQRERQMQVGGSWWGNDAPPFDLSQAISNLALSPQQLQAIDGTLATYEAALTAMFQRVIDNRFEMFTKTFEAYASAGFTDEWLADPVNVEAAMAISTPIWNAYSPRRHAMTQDIVALNRKTIRTLSPILPETTARALRTAFIIATYSNDGMFSEIQSLVRLSSPYDQALARDDLTDEQREFLQAQAMAFQKEVDEAVDAVVARVEKHRDTYVGEYDHQEEFNERSAISRAANDAWQALMTRRKEETEKIAGIIGKTPVAEPEIPDPETADFAKVGIHSILFSRPEFSFWVPPAISGRDIAQYAQWLGLDAARQEQLRALHQHYLEQAAACAAEHRDVVRAASRALNGGDTVEGYTDENLRRYRAAEAAAAVAQHAVEDAFVADVQQTLSFKPDNADFQRVKLARQRQWFNTGIYDSQTRQPGGRWDCLLDVSALLHRIRDLDLSQPEVDHVVAEYEKAVAPLFNARREAMIAYHTVDQELRVEWQERRAETGKAYPDMSDRHAVRGIDQLRGAARNAGEPIAELNRATIDRLVSVLPKESAERVRRTFDRMAWPHIYEDRSCSAPQLSRALELDDLTQQQRAEIENIAAEYHPAYDGLCEKMKAMVEVAGSAIYDQAHATQAELGDFWRRRAGRQRMLFDRHELNVRVWQRLKGVLTVDQAKVIGLGATPPEGPGENDDFGT